MRPAGAGVLARQTDGPSMDPYCAMHLLYCAIHLLPWIVLDHAWAGEFIELLLDPTETEDVPGLWRPVGGRRFLQTAIPLRTPRRNGCRDRDWETRAGTIRRRNGHHRVKASPQNPGKSNGHVHSPAKFFKGALADAPLEMFALYKVPSLAASPESARLCRLHTLFCAAEMLKPGIARGPCGRIFPPALPRQAWQNPRKRSCFFISRLRQTVDSACSPCAKPQDCAGASERQLGSKGRIPI